MGIAFYRCDRCGDLEESHYPLMDTAGRSFDLCISCVEALGAMLRKFMDHGKAVDNGGPIEVPDYVPPDWQP